MSEGLTNTSYNYREVQMFALMQQQLELARDGNSEFYEDMLDGQWCSLPESFKSEYIEAWEDAERIKGNGSHEAKDKKKRERAFKKAQIIANVLADMGIITSQGRSDFDFGYILGSGGGE